MSTETRSAAPAPRRIGRYDVVDEAGRGGMGVVYRARDPQLGRDVAVKMILGAAAWNPSEHALFLREARTTARLSHPGVVRVLDVGVEASLPFIVMEWVEGLSLRDELDRGPLPFPRAAEVVRDVAQALHAAHDAGVIHRDVKPANILIDRRDGRARLTDFGLARDRRHGSPSKKAEVIGTPSYMAPEQAAGARGRQGPACDVWGLGAVLYHALTGRPPHRGRDARDTIRRVLEERVVPVLERDPSVPETLAEIAERCLSRAPELRPSSALMVAAALDRWLAQARPSPPTSPRTSAGRSELTDTQRFAAAGLAAFVLAAGAGLAILSLSGHREPAGTTANVSGTDEHPAPPAIGEVDRGEAPDAALPDAIEAEALHLIASGESARRRGELETASTDLDRAIALAPDLAEGWAGRGAVRLDLGELYGAERDLERALTIVPDAVEYLVLRGRIRFGRRNVDGALADLDRALAIAPALPDALYARGAILALSRRYAEARTDLGVFLAITKASGDPRRAEVAEILGKLPASPRGDDR